MKTKLLRLQILLVLSFFVSNFIFAQQVEDDETLGVAFQQEYLDLESEWEQLSKVFWDARHSMRQIDEKENISRREKIYMRQLEILYSTPRTQQAIDEAINSEKEGGDHFIILMNYIDELFKYIKVKNYTGDEYYKAKKTVMLLKISFNLGTISSYIDSSSDATELISKIRNKRLE